MLRGPVKLGVTGTQSGATQAQLITVTALLRELDLIELNHGDCVGVDDQIARLVRANHPRVFIQAHPCSITHKRAYAPADTLKVVLPPLTRNKNIVNQCNLLLVIPATRAEVLRSGTWQTYRYACKRKRTRVVIYPDGEVKVEDASLR